MPSAAIQSLAVSVEEVEHLLSALESAGPIGPRLDRARVVGRAGVVLLSSHFERYLYAVNEEAVAFINSTKVPSERVPAPIRLLHCREPIDKLGGTEWTNRTGQLVSFVDEDSWLWSAGRTGSIKPDRLLAWMRSPKPAALIRYFGYWGVTDIFKAVTRTPNTRTRMAFLVSELVDKRNNIAHGDFTAQATKVDVQRYAHTVLTFCGRADKVLARAIKKTFDAGLPW